MAFVRTRTGKAGVTSTTLVEAYRDERGQPRQRVLANLHGEPDTLQALAKLAARREALRKERDAVSDELVLANQIHEDIKRGALGADRKKIDRLWNFRDRMVTRLAKIEADLATIQRDGAAIRKHCTATGAEIQAAIRAFKQRYRDADSLVLGMEFVQREQLRKAKAKLRRLSR